MDRLLIKKKFDDYVKKYDMSNDKIYLKYFHTYRVSLLSEKICDYLNLTDEDKDISFAIAMLHDIGRFKQVEEYNTFNDKISTDHAIVGCDLLFKDNMIRDFIIDSKYDEIINKAIKYHNNYEIGNCNEKELLHSKIIRDIDKLDILYNLTYLGGIKFKTDNNPVSKETNIDFKSEQSVLFEHKKNTNDAVLIMLSFIFDLNFDYSFLYLKDNKIIERMKELINNKVLDEYFDKAIKYIDRKCENVR